MQFSQIGRDKPCFFHFLGSGICTSDQHLQFGKASGVSGHTVERWRVIPAHKLIFHFAV
jgi:hypothetical protein